MADHLAEYERAIVLSFELVQTPSLTSQQRLMQSEASMYCERVESAPQGWMASLQLLRTTSRAEVKFYCLQALQKLLNDNGKYGVLSYEERVSLRTSFMVWVSDVCARLQQEPRFVRGKVGVVVALLIKREYPSVWPGAFDELLGLLSAGVGGAEVFVLSLSALDEEVVSLGGNEAMVIKDAMRASCIGKIIAALADIAFMHADNDADMVRRCWLVCGQYVDWVDIGLTTEERFLRVWFMHSMDERFRANAVAALGRLLQKGMDVSNKLRLVAQLGLADACVEFCLRSLHKSGNGSVLNPDANPSPSAWTVFINQYKPVHHSSQPQDDEQYALESARFCQTLGLQLLECRKSFVANGDIASLAILRPLIDKALFCLFSFMGRVDRLDEQSAVLEFANRIVTSNKDTMDASKKELMDHANFFGNEVALRMFFAVLACVRLPEEINLHSVYSSVGTDGSGANGSSMNGNASSSDGGQDLTVGGADDEESEFREHRGNVKRLYLNLVRSATPRALLPLLKNVAEQSLAGYANKMPPHDVEAVMYLVHAFGEGATEVAQRQGALEDIAAFDEVLLTIFQSRAFQGNCHPLLAIMYNELAARYVIALRAQSIEVVAHVVDRVTGSGGLHHNSSKVRTKAAGLLLRIVRSLEGACAQLAERILLASRDVLGLGFEICAIHLQSVRRRGQRTIITVGENNVASQGLQSAGASGVNGAASKKEKIILAVPEIILLYETAGLLLGNSNYWSDQRNRRVYLNALMAPLQTSLEQACVAVNEPSLGPKADEIVHWGACQLEALASFAKGFANQSDSPDILEAWKDILRISLVATVKLEAVSQDLEFLLNNLRRLCHSMIRTIGTEILLFFPDICRALLEAPQADICRALPLFNQMMAAFKSKMHATLLVSLLPILRSTNARIAPIANRPQPTVHDREEFITMEKELFTFLLAVASSDLASVFCEMPNRSHIEELLKMITDGMASIPDASVQRICTSTVQTLCKEWLSTPSTFPEDLRPALVQFTFERITPSSFQATAQPHFDHRDAACNQLLVIVCTLHRTLFELCGQEWLEYVRRVFLPSVNCPPQVAEEYCQAISVHKNAKDLKNVFRKLFLDEGGQGKQ